MNPLKIYEYLVLARGHVFDKVRPLDAAAYGREFPIGLGTLGRTLTHIMMSEWMYVQRIDRAVLPPLDQWMFEDERPPAFAVLEAAWKEQVERTRDVVRRVKDWDAEIEYRVDWGKEPLIVTASASDIFSQLALHEVHHRAQAMNMLRHLGAVIGDIDFNAMMYKRRSV